MLADGVLYVPWLNHGAAAIDANNDDVRVYTGCLLALSGRRNEAIAIGRELGDAYLSAQRGHAADIGAIYASLGDRDTAFAWLERARQSRDPWVPWVAFDPFYDSLRGDPRYASFLASLGLSQ